MLEESAIVSSPSSMNSLTVSREASFGHQSNESQRKRAFETGDHSQRKKSLRSADPPKPYNGREFLVMYGIDDNMAFHLPIKHPAAFCSENIGVYTMDERCRWHVGDKVTISWAGKAVCCKIHAFCETEEEAKVATSRLSEKLTEESMLCHGNKKTANDESGSDLSDREYGSDLDGHSSISSNDAANCESAGIATKRRASAAANRREYDKRIASQRTRRQMELKEGPSNSNNGPTVAELYDLVLQQQKMLSDMQRKLNDLHSKSAHDTNCLRRIERKIGWRAEQHSMVEENAAVSDFFKPSDDLIWMGTDVSEFFNETFTKYACMIRDYLPNVGMLMWGERLWYYFCIPTGNRQKSGAQRRQLLNDKDPTGVACLHKVINKLLIEQAKRSRNAQPNTELSDSFWLNAITKDRKEILGQISQKGLNLDRKRNYTPKAKYYSLIESGNYPKESWTVFSESFDDSEYRTNPTSTIETSVIIELAQKLFDKKEDDNALDQLIAEYKPKYPFLRL